MKATHTLPLLLALGLLCPLSPAQEEVTPTPAEAPADEMKTEKWPDVPEAFFMDKAADEDAFIAQLEPMEALKAMGISFPEGASARYSVRRRTLTVTNTPEELKKVDKVVREFLKSQPEPCQMSWKLSKSYIKEHKDELKDDALAFLTEEYGFELLSAKLTGSKLTVTGTEENLEELDVLLQEDAKASRGKKQKARGKGKARRKADKARKNRKDEAEEDEEDEERDAFES